MAISCQPSRTARAYAATVLAVALSFISPAPVGLAQSAPPPLTPWRGLTDHVSTTLSGAVPSSSVETVADAISGDGRFVVMQSQAWDLVADDFNGGKDVFLRDRQTGTTTRVSVPDGGGEANDWSDLGTISTNGRHVAFISLASNLVPGDTNWTYDVFVRDLDRARTVRVSVATGGTQADGLSYWPSISATGRFVAFVSQSTTLTSAPAQPPYPVMQVYVHDRDADGNGTFDEPGGTSTTLDSLNSSGEVGNLYADYPRISGDGRFVIFESPATNLDPVGNPNWNIHLYLRDRQAGTTTLVDRAMTGGPSAAGVDYRSADLTDDGRYITYTSYATDIVPIEPNWNTQLFRYDALASGLKTSLVTVRPDGALGNGATFNSSLSHDGRYIAFRSSATNLANPAPLPQTAGVFVRDMVEGTFTRVDVTNDGQAFDHEYPYGPAISADGTAVAFSSNAVNAVDGAYSFGAQHAFVATAFSLSPTAATFQMEGGIGSIEVNTLPVTGWKASTYEPWITLMDGAEFGAGPRTVQYMVGLNEAGIVRDGSIRIGSITIPIHQYGDGDTTPPVITPIITGTRHPSGWYTSNITVQWSVTDAESEIIYLSPSCATSTFTSDFIWATPSCQATSHGGPASYSVPLRRDTTAPSIFISWPPPALYPSNVQSLPIFGCNDFSGYAGVATCAITEGSSPLDTTTPGWHRFTVTGTDNAGNTASKTVEYLIGSGICVPQPAGLKGWWPFNGGWYDLVHNLGAGPWNAQGGFENAVAGQGWTNGSPGNFLDVTDESRFLIGPGLTVAMWVRPWGQSGQSGTLITKPAHYRIARYPDGTLRWAFSHTNGYTWVNTGVVIPAQYYSHVAVTYNNGLVKSYLNGRLVHTQQLTGSLVTAGDPNASLTMGGRRDLAATLYATIDDPQIYDRALSEADLSAIAQSASGSLCIPNSSTMTLTSPLTIQYGQTFTATLFLRNGTGAPTPLPNKEVLLTSRVGSGGFSYTVSSRTDVLGRLTWNLPVGPAAPLGHYATAVTAVFGGDNIHTGSSASASANLVAGTSIVNWSPPAPIAYGTALGSQLNATANNSGSFSYSPAAGTVLDAGTHTLSVTFTPSTTQWAPATKTTTLVVNKAVPVVTATGGVFTYDKQPHPGGGTATGLLGAALSPVQLTYDGTSETAPIGAGAHTVRASFAGSANYMPAESAPVPLTINKAVPTVEVSSTPVFYTGAPRQALVTIRGVGSDELNPFTVLYNGAAALPVQAGTYAVHVQFDGNANYEGATGDGTLVINKTTPIMSIGADNATYDGQPHYASAAAVGVGNEPLTPIVITYNGSPTAPTDAGVYAVEARYEGSANYNAISRTTTLTISKKVPYLQWFPGPDSIFYGTPLGAAQFGATANVPGAFSYSPAEGTILNAGSHTLTATFTPADEANHTTASTTATLSVMKATPSLTWPSPANVAYGTELGSAQLNASVNVPGTFTYTPPAGTVLNAGTHVLRVGFTPDDAANYNSILSAGTVFTVTKAPAAITWPAPAGIVYGTALDATQLNATASVPGAFAYSPALGTVLAAGAHTLTVTFTPTDAANYSGGSASVTLAVAPASTSITWSAPSGIVYGTPLGAAQLNATASVPGTFSYSPSAGAVLAAGTHTLSVTFTPTDAVNYTGGSETVTVTVTQASTSITWPAPAGIGYGAALGAGQLNATANVPGTFSYSPSAGAVLPAGAHTLSVTFTPADGVNHTPSSITRPLTVAKAPLTVTTNNASKRFGAPVPPFSATPAGFVNGDSMASLGGALTFATAATASSPVGTYPVTPQGVASPNYTIGFVSGTLTVLKADTALAVAASPSPAGLNQPVTYAATVAVVAPGAGVPGGTVQFFDGSTLVGTAALTGGSASLTTNGLSSGSHTISATYSGDASFGGSTGSTALTVKSSSTSSTTTLTSSRNPATSGQSVTFNASVTGPAGTVNGTVQFYDGSVLLGSATISSGVARLTTSSLSSGGHAITARYLGNASLPPSVSTAVAQTIGTQTRTSSIALTPSPAPAPLGAEVAITAVVTGSNQRTPTGVVLFMVNGQVLGQVQTAPSGGLNATAVLRTSALPRGTHSIVAVYLADVNLRASTRVATLIVN